MQEGKYVKEILKQTKSTLVSKRTKQVGETHSNWAWVESSVWTGRMLTTLESGVKGNKWFSLIDKVYRPRNLLSASQRVRANKGSAGVDNVTVNQFAHREPENIRCLSESIKSQTYRPGAIKRVMINKTGSKELRPLGIPTVRDRVVQTALRNVLEPIFEKGFAEHSYGFRPKRGCKDALRKVDALLKSGYHWVVDADLKSYFDTIDHEKLMVLIKDKISDSRVLALIEMFMKQEILCGVKEWTPEKGSPQGAVLSPLLSNIYLNPLDHLMANAGFEMIRYADDFVILCKSESEAQEALQEITKWCQLALLTLHPEKTKLVDATLRGGFDFLGYHFERGYKWPSKKSRNKFKRAIKKHTLRCNGHSLEMIIKIINPKIKGWYEYFKHSYKTEFPGIDGWVRMRLRSILRKRQKRKGRGRGKDHQRWPNKFFLDHGLFSLTIAHGNHVNPH